MAFIHTIKIEGRPTCIFCKQPLTADEIKQALEPKGPPHCMDQVNKNCDYCDRPCAFVIGKSVKVLGRERTINDFVFACNIHVFANSGLVLPAV